MEFPFQYLTLNMQNIIFPQELFLGFKTRYKRHRLKVAGIARTLLLGTPFEQITAFVLIYTLGFTKSWSPNLKQNTKLRRSPLCDYYAKRVAVLLSVPQAHIRGLNEHVN